MTALAFAKFKEAIKQDNLDLTQPITPLLDNQSDYNIVESTVTEAADDDARAGPLLAAPARMLAKPGTSFFTHSITGRNSMTPPSSNSPDEESPGDDDDDMSDIDDTVYTARING